MTLRILTTGRLVSDPRLRTSAKGREYITAMLRASVEARSEDEPDSVLVSVIAFEAAAVERLKALAKGDSVSVSGPARLTSWTGRDGEESTGLSVVAEAALTAYGVRKRKVAADDGTPFDDPLP